MSRVDRYWIQFLESIPDGRPKPERYVEAFFFGTDPSRAHEITPLVLDGTKTATGSLLWAVEADGRQAARPGDHWIVTNGADDPQCVIETRQVEVLPFDEVGEDYARWGGEAGRTLEGWRALYWDYITSECARLGRTPDPKAPLVMECFRVVYAAPLAGDRVRATIDRLIEQGRVVADADGSTHDVRTVSISPSEGEALSRWVLRENATRTIEIGLGYGFSALHVCDALLRSGRADVRHVVLDPFQSRRFADCGLQVLREAGVASLVEHHDRASQIALPAFLEEGRDFDLAFVDGNHRFDAVFVDLYYLGRLLPKGSIVLLDDYDLPGIRRAVSFYLHNLDWRVEETSREDDEHHWVALRTSAAGDTRDFRDFVEF